MSITPIETAPIGEAIIFARQSPNKALKVEHIETNGFDGADQVFTMIRKTAPCPAFRHLSSQGA